MQQRQLGTYGPTISAIGIGAMSFSDFYGATNEAESHSILTAALIRGSPILIQLMFMETAPLKR